MSHYSLSETVRKRLEYCRGWWSGLKHAVRLSIFTDIDERQYDDLVYNFRKILVKMVYLIMLNR